MPAARRLAREHGVDLAVVADSRPGGRITEADVAAHLEERGAGTVLLTDTRGITARRRALTERVRAGRAGLAELQGSTFTITNLGHAGIDAFTPIINPPEVAILGTGRVTDQPAPDGPGVAWRKSVTLSLTAHHRADDGAPAARFLATLAGYLSKPTALS